MSDLQLPDDHLVRAYWVEESARLGLNDVDTPEAWAFGRTAQQADELLGLVLTGIKTATFSAHWSYEADDEPLPAVGQLSIVCDGQGRPQAVLQVTDIAVTAFDAVSETHASVDYLSNRDIRRSASGLPPV